RRTARPRHIAPGLGALHGGQPGPAPVGDGGEAGVVGRRRGAGERGRAAERLLDAARERLAAQGDEVCRRGGDALLAAEEPCSLVGGRGRRRGEERDEGGEGRHAISHSVRHASRAGGGAWDATQQEACRKHTRPTPSNLRPADGSPVAPAASRQAVDVGRAGCERPFMSSAVTYEAGERIARIALDDGKVNAMSLGFFEALGAALDRAERERPGAVIITGRPGVFSAGLDLKLLPTLGAAE